MAYQVKVKDAILKLKERSGSSLYAIKKALKAKPAQFRFINAALAKGVASGFFVKNGGKYKLSAAAKKPPAKPKKKKKKAVKKKKKKAVKKVGAEKVNDQRG